MAKHKRTITGDCGEFYVASLLAGIGADVMVTRVNAMRNDLHVTLGRRSFTLQVKSGRRYTSEDRKRVPKNAYWVWRAGKKCAEISNSSHWYAFVYLGEWPRRGDAPKVFFISSKAVRKTLSDKKVTSGEWFWMRKHRAEKLCGLPGIKRMRKALAGK